MFFAQFPVTTFKFVLYRVHINQYWDFVSWIESVIEKHISWRQIFLWEQILVNFTSFRLKYPKSVHILTRIMHLNLVFTYFNRKKHLLIFLDPSHWQIDINVLFKDFKLAKMIIPNLWSIKSLSQSRKLTHIQNSLTELLCKSTSPFISRF